MTEHAVYPAGPSCQPNCPGPSSMYHDGYADGFERAEAEATAAAEQRLASALRQLVKAVQVWQEQDSAARVYFAIELTAAARALSVASGEESE